MDEHRLPFPIHGTRLTGDGDPQRGVGEAARLLYFVNLIAETAGVPVFQLSRQTPYGAVTASVHGPLAFKSVKSVTEPEGPQEQEETTGLARLVWLPEGFVITPRTAEAPEGYGMPQTPAPLPPQEGGALPPKKPTAFEMRGTPGGPLREVIINRLENNKYPDSMYEAFDKRNKKTEATRSVCAAGLMFMGWELDEPDGGARGGGFSVGMSIAGKWVPQFSERFKTNFDEIDVSRWYCHRPMVDPGEENEFLKRMRDKANEMRAAVGRVPLGRPLRGSDGMLSESVIYAARYSGVMAHDCDLFREGHKKFFDRAQLRCGAVGAWRVGENLTTTDGTVDNGSVDRAMVQWKNSPGHYRNIIGDWGDNDGDGDLYPSVDSAARALEGDTIKGGIGPPYLITTPIQFYDSPVSGSMFSQIFNGRKHFVGHGVHDGRHPIPIGIEPQFAGASFFSPFQYVHGGGPPDEPLPTWSPSGTSGERRYMYQGVFCHGHEIPVICADPEDDDPPAPESAAILSAAAANVGGVQVLRVITLDRPHEVITKSRPAALVVREGRLHDFWKTQKVVGRFDFPLDTGSMSTIKVSASGDKAVFCYSVTEPCLTRVHWRIPDHPDPSLKNLPAKTTEWSEGHDRDKDPLIWGGKLRFVEWTASSGFSTLFDSSVDVEPEWTFDDWPGRDPEFLYITYSQKCKGEYKLFADYDGDSLVYATAHVDCSYKYRIGSYDIKSSGIYEWLGGPPQSLPHLEKKLYGKIVFPDTTEFVYSDTTALIEGPEIGGDPYIPAGIQNDGARGTFREILHLDILRPGNIVHIQYDLGGSTQQRLPIGDGRSEHFPTAKCSIVSCGTVVKELENVMAPAARDEFYENITHLYIASPLQDSVATPLALSFAGFAQYCGYYYRGERDKPMASFVAAAGAKPQMPAAPFKAMLFDDAPLPGLMFRGNETFAALPQIVGPRFYRGRYKDQPFAHLVHYKGQSIAAGKVNSPFGFEFGGWIGDAGYFFQSSLDLKAITGLSDLKDNILPIGVL